MTSAARIFCEFSLSEGDDPDTGATCHTTKKESRANSNPPNKDLRIIVDSFIGNMIPLLWNWVGISCHDERYNIFCFNDSLQEWFRRNETLARFVDNVASPGICGYLECHNVVSNQNLTFVGRHSLMILSKNAKIRILIAAALIIGWIIVVFFRSGTAWG